MSASLLLFLGLFISLTLGGCSSYTPAAIDPVPPITTAAVPSSVPTPNTTSAAFSARLVADTVSWRAITAGNFLVWFDMRNPSTHPDARSLYACDLTTQETFLVTDSASAKAALTSDGATIVWIESGSIRGYHLPTRRFVAISDLFAGSIDGLALYHGVLYYHDTAPGHRGLYARTLATNHEQRISPNGRNPVAADNVLLWSEVTDSGEGAGYTHWTLHLRDLNGGTADRVLAHVDGQGGFNGYAVSGAYVVWAAFPTTGDGRVYLYDIRQGSSKPISSVDQAAFNPTIRGDHIAWAAVEWSNAPPSPTPWSLPSYDIGDGMQTMIIPASESQLVPWGIAGQSTLAFTTGASQAYPGQPGLYISTIK